MAIDATGQFSVANGQIIDPSGAAFVARGINVFPGQVDAATILRTFPGINAVRVAATPGTDPGTLDSLVQGLTSKGVVVLIEDHSSSGGNPNTLSGQALANEASWYAGMASKYQSNPDVWFGTANEPDNSANLQAIPDQERAIYDAIRGTGSKAMVMLEERGGGYSEDAVAQSPGTYATMTNVAWDTHYYGWLTNYSTDPAAIANSVQSQIALAQSVRSADGLVPVIIGEYGPSTTGLAGYDANGLQVVQAVDNSGKGTFAWAYNAGTDALTNGGGLTDFGQLVAKHIAAGGSAAPSAPAPDGASRATPAPNLANDSYQSAPQSTAASGVAPSVATGGMQPSAAAYSTARSPAPSPPTSSSGDAGSGLPATTRYTADQNAVPRTQGTGTTSAAQAGTGNLGLSIGSLAHKMHHERAHIRAGVAALTNGRQTANTAPGSKAGSMSPSVATMEADIIQEVDLPRRQIATLTKYLAGQASGT